ncbi:unnamed protein product, partial [Brassica oleracea var. botrytis]
GYLSPKNCIDYGFWKKKILLLKKDRVNPVLLDFKIESEDRCWWEVNQGNTSEK